MLKLLAYTATLLLCGCLVGPRYHEPHKPVASHWPKKDSSVKESTFKNVLWWQVFHDPTLTRLIFQGYCNNLSLKSAGVRVLQARAQLAQSVGQLYPQQQAMIGNLNYNRIGGSSLQSILPSNFNTALLGFSANWEIDFWGKYRRAIEANDATFLASLAAYDYALITLIADIASAYVQLRSDEAQIHVTKENIKVQKTGVRIARSRFNAGETNLVDVEQAETELAQTQATLPSLLYDVEQQKNTLALLLATIPNGVDDLLRKGHGIPIAPATVAVGIPKETIIRRPDIYQARMEAIAQSASIGAAKANLFPSFSLNGTFAFAANTINGSSLGNLFNWSNRTITAGPGLNWPLLNYGQITNAVRVQDAAFQQAVLSYVNLVLQAQQEVQNSITGYIEAKNKTHALSKANQAAIKTLKLTLIRYMEGETDFTPVLNAEQQQLSVQISLVTAQASIPQSLISLYRSLGGGWQIRGNNDLIDPQLKAEMAARTNWGTILEQQNHMAPTTKKQQFKQLYLPKW